MLQCPFESERFARVAYLWLQALSRSAMCALLRECVSKLVILQKQSRPFEKLRIPNTLRGYQGCSNLKYIALSDYKTSTLNPISKERG